MCGRLQLATSVRDVDRATRAWGGVRDDASRAMAPADGALVRSSEDGRGESEDDDDADVLQPWVKRRRCAAVAAPSRATRAERAVRERVVAAMRDRTIARDDAPEEDASEEEEAREEETREEPPTLSRNENNQWSFRESVPVFESNEDVEAKLRARAREMSEREKRSLILRARAEREEARAETFNVSAAVGAAEREKRRERW